MKTSVKTLLIILGLVIVFVVVLNFREKISAIIPTKPEKSFLEPFKVDRQDHSYGDPRKRKIMPLTNDNLSDYLTKLKRGQFEYAMTHFTIDRDEATGKQLHFQNMVDVLMDIYLYNPEIDHFIPLSSLGHPSRIWVNGSGEDISIIFSDVNTSINSYLLSPQTYIFNTVKDHFEPEFSQYLLWIQAIPSSTGQDAVITIEK